MRAILENPETLVLVEDGVDTSTKHFPVILKSKASGKQQPVKDVQQIFKFGNWTEVEDSTQLKAKFKQKG